MVTYPWGGYKKTSLLQSLLLAFLFILAVYILFNSEVFIIEEINVEGNNKLQKREIINEAELVTGVNIFKVDVKNSESNLHSLPLIEEVEIKRKLPKTIEIVIEERTAAALLPGEDGFIEIDGSCVYLDKSRKIRDDLPVITGIDYTLNAPGERVKGAGLQVALEVIKTIPGDLNKRLSEVHYEEDGSVVLYTLRGIQCRMGMPYEIDKKCDVFLRLLQKVQEKDSEIEYVDLSSIDSPVVKYKK